MKKMTSNKLSVTCDMCGVVFQRSPSRIVGQRHLFCSKKCLWDFSSKEKNPYSYGELKDLQPVSEHMSELNRRLNPTRMTDEVREKIRNAHVNSGKGKTYSKRYGRHEHRVVVEQILGRKLESGEVVHHLNFNPRDNAPENLMVFPSQAEHAKYHKLLTTFFFLGIVPERSEIKGGDAV